MPHTNEIELQWTQDEHSDIKEPSQSGKGDGFTLNLTPRGVSKAAEAFLTNKLLRLNVALDPSAFKGHFPELRRQ